jgi:hypothetical protein
MRSSLKTDIVVNDNHNDKKDTTKTNNEYQDAGQRGKTNATTFHFSMCSLRNKVGWQDCNNQGNEGKKNNHVAGLLIKCRRI